MFYKYLEMGSLKSNVFVTGGVPLTARKPPAGASRTD